MKINTRKIISLFTFFIVLLIFYIIDNKKNFFISKLPAKLPTTINLNFTNDKDIREYYSFLNHLPEKEKSGKNLLKNLKIIIKNARYYDYNDIQKIYTITERDWKKSKINGTIAGQFRNSKNEIINFNYEKEIRNNPFIKILYVNYRLTESTRFLVKNINKINFSFDKEHIWPKSRGFKTKTKKIICGPGTDLHNLVAADSTVNRYYHVNYLFGDVKFVKKKANKNTKSMNNFFIYGNKLGFCNNFLNKKNKTVFEPIDENKGRIARSLLYMAARYNDYYEDKDDFNLNLELVEDIDNDLNNKTKSKYGKIKNILEWHKKYPPDNFEIYRNNLIYNNFQYNRNPFIDFPEWSDYIWGNNDTNYIITGFADPLKNRINNFNYFKNNNFVVKKTNMEKDFSYMNIFKNNRLFNFISFKKNNLFFKKKYYLLSYLRV